MQIWERPSVATKQKLEKGTVILFNFVTKNVVNLLENVPDYKLMISNLKISIYMQNLLFGRFWYYHLQYRNSNFTNEERIHKKSCS